VRTVLDTHLELGTLVSIYGNRFHWDRFSFGQIIYVSQEIYVIKAYSKFGNPDGYEVRRVSDVTKIEFGGLYERSLGAIVEREGLEHHGYPFTLPQTGSPVAEILLMSKMLGAIINVWGADDDHALTGSVSLVDPTLLQLDLVSSFGEDDGVAIVYVNEVSAIDFETREMQLLRKFRNSAQKEPVTGEP
jgi:hypothetical protein